MYDIRDKAESIRQIQRFLISFQNARNGFSLLTADGVYGEETASAVKDFQRSQGLLETGTVDLDTWELLFMLYEQNEETSESDLVPEAAFPLRMGDSGSTVSILQTVLEELLEINLDSDGFFGRRTEDAVRTLERRLGDAPTGLVGKSLWRRMAIAYKEKSARRFYPLA